MIHIVGAGCGAPDLVTLRAKKFIEEADVIIYAGSLVNPALLLYAKEGCAIYNSAEMTLEEVLSVMEKADADGKEVVRLHTGDPSLYGAVKEQMDALFAKGIAYDITPGVSAFSGAAASLGAEYTLPNVSQTLVITRMQGKTAVPQKERLRDLALHGASMAIYLSAGLADEVQDELLQGAYTPGTPAAIVYKATWEDEKIFRCTVGTLAKTAKKNGITKTALIVVGDFLDASYEKSRLYAPDFATEYRKAKEDSSAGESLQTKEKNTELRKAADMHHEKNGVVIICFTDAGERTAERIAKKYDACEIARCPRDGSLSAWVEKHFACRKALLFVGAVGIAVRAVAPFVRDKTTDPAVLAIDEGASYVIPLLSGHIGGANHMAEEIAKHLKAAPVITTATDIRGEFAVDVWAKEHNYFIFNPERIKMISAAVLSNEQVIMESPFPITGELPPSVRVVSANVASRTEAGSRADKGMQTDAGVRTDEADHARRIVLTIQGTKASVAAANGALVLIPRHLCLGIGCRKGAHKEQITSAVHAFMNENDYLPEALFAVASIDKKADEPGLLAFCAERRLQFQTFSAEELAALKGDFSHSDFVEKTVGTGNVCERAAVAAANGGMLLVKKSVFNGVTLALAVCS